MFGALGGAASADLALEAFEDDVKTASRSVSSCDDPLKGSMSPLDTQPPRNSQ